MKPNLYPSLLLIPLFLNLPLIAGDEIELTLADAVAKTLKSNPAMSVFDAGIRIAEADFITAITRPNPELETEIEDVLGSGEYSRFESAIYNVGVSQLIETGGKRRLRGEIARAGQSVQELQYEAARRELIVETSRRFITVLALQDAEDNARENLRIAEAALEAINKQIEGGRGNAVDSGQALLGKNEASLAYENARRESGLARQQLSVMWAVTKPKFSSLNGTLLKPAGQIPGVDSLHEGLGSHPVMELAASGIQVAESQFRLEEKKRAPDVTVGLGYRRDSTINDNALVIGFSVPLPLFDKNKGGIARANAEIERQEALLLQVQTELESRVAGAHSRLSAAKLEYDLVSGEMLEAAEKHHATVSEGFALGRIKYLDLLEARRSLNAVRKQKIDALARYHTARVELESITGREF